MYASIVKILVLNRLLILHWKYLVQMVRRAKIECGFSGYKFCSIHYLATKNNLVSFAIRVFKEPWACICDLQHAGPDVYPIHRTDWPLFKSTSLEALTQSMITWHRFSVRPSTRTRTTFDGEAARFIFLNHPLCRMHIEIKK